VNGELEAFKNALPFLIPVLVLEVVLLFIAIIDLDRREHVTGNNKLIWVLVIVLIGIIGPVIYFVFGRKKKSAVKE
jgi:TctA family transporter